MKKQKNKEVARTVNIVNSNVGVVGKNNGSVTINDDNNKRKAELEEEKDSEIEEEANVYANAYKDNGIEGLRLTIAKRKIEESTSASTKFETKSVKTKNMPITIEISNAEFKKMDADDDFITIQQNKNIRTSKSILSSIFTLNSGKPVIGLDFVGLSGYLFSAQYLESAVFITREADVYLPGDTVDLDEFMDECEEVLALIFAYKNYIVKQARDIDQKCRALRRRRLVASTEDNREYLPPTFYSPKR
ncbi:hypothetical protein BDF20DRAFT_911423 [Mycotypha africana]|uniref:uncharacterized protein n=1 Tax=Mycotypha africana TaxID=64632 RepID=UPI0023005AF4|nr:uncharacterized protein BDF20DRAFT_911423 [Mycotypha africana]KAI8984307.1 hypothetical protein BDF20DRAFT_911423 [Mycotypha africana]